jgi:F0F1-type ATP synthase assembly protein I
MGMASKPDKSLFWLGKYLALAMTLPASLVAGYLLGAFAGNHLHLPVLRVVGILFGFMAGLIQVFKELARDEKRP